MLPIVDFPPEVLSQIFGSDSTSYLVIKIWLCGSLKLNEKLSRGLSYLDVAVHRFATCKFPRLVFEFQNLRHFVIRSSNKLLSDPSHWTGIIKSLPKTLVSLTISSLDNDQCLTDFDAVDAFSADTPVTSPQGALPALNLASLLPCLQTLTFPFIGETIPAHRFSCLPYSLTELNASINISYVGSAKLPCRFLSQLPRGLLKVKGYLKWGMFDLSGRHTDAADVVEQFHDDVLNAPPDLEFLSIKGMIPAVLLSKDQVWLPKSLLNVAMPSDSAFNWSPSIALTLPSNLHTLVLGSVNLPSFVNTRINWVASLPRTLTNLEMEPSRFPLDFTTFSHCLPPNLTELSLSIGYSSDVTLPFGDWSRIETSNVENGKHWPKSLTSLKLIRFRIGPSDIAKLPRTLLKLGVIVSSISESAVEMNEIASKHFPPHLTDLTLDWSGAAKLPFNNLRYLTMLKECLLIGDIAHPEGAEDDASSNVSLDSPVLNTAHITPLYISQRLKSLKMPSWHCDWFKLLPRGLELFEAQSIPGLAESPLLATHDVFKDLPTSLLYVVIRSSESEDQRSALKIPPQRFDHLSSLVALAFTIAIVPSAIIRLLPKSLRAFQLVIEEWDESDLLFFPPRLEIVVTDAFKDAPMAKIIHHLPLTALNGLGILESVVEPEDRELISKRVEYEVKHP